MRIIDERERDNTERDKTATRTIHNISLSGEEGGGGGEREKAYVYNISLFREEKKNKENTIYRDLVGGKHNY